LVLEFEGRIDILAVSFSERNTIETILGEQPRRYSVAVCGDSRAWSEWRITRVPTIFLLDPRGILIAQWTGVKPVEEERSILEKLALIGPLRES
jgi:hypothetical protein